MQKIYDLTIITPKLKARLDNWASDNSGMAAVEFAFSTTLEHGLTEASRQIRTGSFQQNPGSSLASFKQDVCDELFDLLDCPGGLILDITTFSNFSSTARPSRIDSDGEFSAEDEQFSPGSRNDPLSNLANGNLLIESGIAFRNEPFS